LPSNEFYGLASWQTDCPKPPRPAESLCPFDNGTPAARPVRKVRDLSEIA